MNLKNLTRPTFTRYMALQTATAILHHRAESLDYLNQPTNLTNLTIPSPKAYRRGKKDPRKTNQN